MQVFIYSLLYRQHFFFLLAVSMKIFIYSKDLNSFSSDRYESRSNRIWIFGKMDIKRFLIHIYPCFTFSSQKRKISKGLVHDLYFTSVLFWYTDTVILARKLHFEIWVIQYVSQKLYIFQKWYFCKNYGGLWTCLNNSKNVRF